MNTRAHVKRSSSISMDPQGRVLIPSSIRKTLGLNPGDKLVVIEDEAGIVIQTPEQLLAHMQRDWQKAIPSSTCLVDELIAERRSEAKKELSG